MRDENTKTILGVAIGAAIGAAIAYLVVSDKKEDWIRSAGQLAEKVKYGLADTYDKYKSRSNF